MTFEELKKEAIIAYELHVINCMNESGTLKIDEYIESFICWVDFNLRTSGDNLEELQQLFNTTDIMKICNHIKNIILKYENIGA